MGAGKSYSGEEIKEIAKIKIANPRLVVHTHTHTHTHILII